MTTHTNIARIKAVGGDPQRIINRNGTLILLPAHEHKMRQAGNDLDALSALLEQALDEDDKLLITAASARIQRLLDQQTRHMERLQECLNRQQAQLAKLQGKANA